MINDNFDKTLTNEIQINEQYPNWSEILPGVSDEIPLKALVEMFNPATPSNERNSGVNQKMRKCNLCSNNSLTLPWVDTCHTCGFNINSYTKKVLNSVRRFAGFSLTDMAKLTGFTTGQIENYEKGPVEDGYYQAFKKVITHHYKK